MLFPVPMDRSVPLHPYFARVSIVVVGIIVVLRVSLLLRRLRQSLFPDVVGSFTIEIRENKVKDLLIPAHGVAFDVFLDILCTSSQPNTLPFTPLEQ